MLDLIPALKTRFGNYGGHQDENHISRQWNQQASGVPVVIIRVFTVKRHCMTASSAADESRT